MSDHLIHHAAKELVHAVNKAVDENLPKDIADIVKSHSFGAATAGVAAGWIPGAGGLAAAGIAAGFVWTMYGRINGKIGLSITDNLLKTLSSGVATNLAAYVVGGLVMSAVFSMIPGIGSVGASLVAGATAYALTLASGYVYLRLLTDLFKSGRDPSTMDADALKRAADSVVATENIKAVIDEAKTSYTAAKKAGE